MRHLRLPVQAKDLPTAIFGAWDGCISILGVLVASSHLRARQLLIAGIGGSVSGTFSMATGQFEAMDTTTKEKIRQAVIMGVFTLLGGLLFVLPFLLGKTWGYVLGTVLTISLATIVWLLKKEGLVGALRTYALLGVTALATIAVSILLA